MKKAKQNQKEQKKMFFEYQGAELKNFYNKYIMRALIFSLAVHIVAVGAWFVSSAVNDANADKKEEVIKRRYIEVSEPPMIDETKVETPPTIEEPKMIPKKDLAALIPKPVKQVDAQEVTTKTQNELDKIKVNVSSDGSEDGQNITDGTFVIKDQNIIKNIDSDKDKNINVDKDFKQFEVEQAPVPVNLSSIQGSMHYPQSAIDNGVEGRVVVKLLVGKDGNVMKISSISGPDVFKDEVRNKVSGLVFTPAMQNGQTVKCWVSVPFSFKLKSSFK